MSKSLGWQAYALGAMTLCIMAPGAAAEAPRWRMQYFYDQNKTELSLHDIQTPSAKRGFAIGTIQDERGGSRKPVAVTTADGGAHWEQMKLEEHPVSLFFLNDSLGWMVTEKGIWRTSESGKDWKKLPKPPTPALRVYFVDENNGWAACTKKTVLETHDGGNKWEAIKTPANLPGAPERSAFSWITFANKDYGLVLGFNQPLSRWGSQFPAWMDPEDAMTRRDTPHLSYTMVTNDRGKTWRAGSTSLFGQVTRARFSAEGPGMGLIEMGHSSNYPSEVYELDWKTGRSHTVFRDKRYFITDIWLTPNGTSYIAGVELAGQLHSIAPGTVKVFKSADRKVWEEMPVDYRAVANRVTLAGAGDENLWLATDNGMILKLQ